MNSSINSIQLLISNEVHEVTIKEYQGQRAVSFRDVDNLHRRPTGSARKTFNSHRKQFVEGEDYFVLNTDEAKNGFGLRAPNGIFLLTESGYLLLVKPFTDDLAWQIQRQLVKSYFKIKQAVQESQVPTSQEDIMIYALQSQKEMKLRLDNLEHENKQLKLVVDNEVILTKHQRSEIHLAVKRRQGQLNREGYVSAHFQGVFSTLKEHFGVPSYHDIARSDFDTALKIIAGWYPKKNESNSQEA